ncbi:P-loop containing nucleoside triphosphate hydrolase protein [Massarina eburnea CBS 473.64]|uniref:P-loop containing nucleoside triphosphate hydrolase protein n=1 Tax=Massarina eburnea CBS 473.64 TaxID=1395130 RepID=A0A6A6RYJ1_9PLEO|nr:P-loop containing nucleoside triphosphate hydrolase protein [Massarina eburnea CBS 473.64]
MSAEKEKDGPQVKPPLSTVVPDPTTHIQVIDEATAEKSQVAESKDDPPEAKKKPQASLKNYFRVFSYGAKFDAFLMGLSFLTSIGSGTALPLMNITGQLVGNFTEYFVPNSTITRQEFQASVNQNALYFVYLFIGKFVLSYVSMLSVRIAGLSISAGFRLAYLRATFAQTVSVIDTVSPGKVSTRITTSSNTVQLGISQHFAMTFQALAMTVGLYVVAFIKGWLLTLIASAALPLILIVYGVLIPPIMKIHKITEELHEEASALSFEMFSSIRVVVAFGAEAKLAKQHETLLEKAYNNARREAPLMGMMMSPSMAAMYGTFGLAFYVGIRQYSSGNIANVGNIVVVLFSVMTAVMNIGRLAHPIIGMVKAATAATELFATIDSEVTDTSGLKDPEVSADVDIFFDDVAFSYPSRPNVPILEGFSARFEAGKVTAIVGPSGSGKSTLVSLIQRWYDLLGTTALLPPNEKTELDTPSVTEHASEHNSNKKDKAIKTGKTDQEEDIDLGPNTCTGAVRIGDTNLRDVDSRWWRSNCGLVQQEPFLFNDTLFNNVAYGLSGTKWQHAPKEEQLAMVKAACNEAYATEFIDRLPSGFDTSVGESGIKLSGGQRQRIAIARAIVKNPSILILDEATSAIDVRTERIVQEALERVSTGRTTITIAHRLSTIKKADKILVMRKGKLVEEGNHEELLKNEDGIYYGLVNAQKLTMEAEEENDLEDVGPSKVKTADSQKCELQERESHDSEEDEEWKDKNFVKSGGKLLAEQRHHWFLYSLAILGILTAGVVYPVQAYVFANVVQVFTLTGSEFISKGYFWSGMFGVEALVTFVAYFTIGFAAHKISIAITRHYRQEYLENIMLKRIAFFDMEGHSAGSLTSRVSADTEQLQQLMSTEMSLAMISCVNLLGSLIIAFIYGWKFTLVGLFAALPFILAAGFMRLSLEMKFEKMNAAVFEESSQFATEAVGAFRTVVSLIMEDVIGDRYRDLLSEHVKKAFSTAKYGTLVFAASDSVDMACMALAFWYGGTLLASKEYNIVDFFIIYMSIVYGAIGAGMWFSMAPNISQATAAANRVLSMRPPSNTPPPNYSPISHPTSSVGIEFRNVEFAYKSRSVPVLSGLNITVAPGQFAALVGASGCGKSTSISLLERFYDADAGTVLYNGQDITTLDPAIYRSNISLVSQEPTLYEGTIRDNIALSVESATDADIEQACSDAQIHEFITSLPEGYTTRLGPKGMSLSGGQKQRLSLARALLRKPKLLLLDEATSSLDSESEKLVQAAIERAAGEDGRTVVAVAHRLATIQKADVIFVLGSGRVLEKGDHLSLLRRRGVYYQMCQAQALDR